ncbi:MAG: response regulator [Methylobacter sp.]
MESLAELLDALARLMWPALVAVVLWKLYPELQKAIRTRCLTVKYGDMEVTVQESSDQLKKQIADLQNQVLIIARTLHGRKNFAQSDKTSPELAPTADHYPTVKQILWVDDVPENNAYEIMKLKEDGLQIIQVQSTAQAMEVIKRGELDIDIVISDMARKENSIYKPFAGISLIKAVRDARPDVPVIVYSSAEGVEASGQRAIEAGAYGITASPLELFQLIRDTRLKVD